MSRVLLQFCYFLVFIHQIKAASIEAPDEIDWSELHSSGDFYQQTEVVLHRVRMPRNEIERFDILKVNLQRELRKIWPDCQLNPFGSLATGFGLLWSDIDWYVTFASERNDADNLVTQATELLTRNDTFSILRSVTNVTVPLITLFYKPTQQECDISFTNIISLIEVKLIRYFSHINHKIFYLMLLVKYWTKVHNLTKLHVMPNYAWTLLVIFYLQQIDILPSVYNIQKNVNKEIVNNWNVAMEEPYKYLYSYENEEPLYKLVGGFLEYYSDFDFENNVISVYTGTTIPKKAFNDFDDLPKALDFYKYNVKNNITKPVSVNGLFCIPDPFSLNRNTAAVTEESTAKRIKTYLQEGAKLYRELNEGYFLEALLTMNLDCNTKQTY